MSQTVSAETHYIPIVAYLDGAVRRVVEVTAWLNVILAFLILVTVILRYAFHRNGILLSWPLVPMEELMWHIYSVPVMFGLAYAITNDTHIRIDIFRFTMSNSSKYIFEIFGILFLLLPCLLILLDFSFDFAVYALTHNESSQSTMGLPHRWIVKSIIPLSMVLMIISTIARLIENGILLFNIGQKPRRVSKDRSTVRELFEPLLKTKKRTSKESNS